MQVEIRHTRTKVLLIFTFEYLHLNLEFKGKYFRCILTLEVWLDDFFRFPVKSASTNRDRSSPQKPSLQGVSSLWTSSEEQGLTLLVPLPAVGESCSSTSHLNESPARKHPLNSQLRIQMVKPLENWFPKPPIIWLKFSSPVTSALSPLLLLALHRRKENQHRL